MEGQHTFGQIEALENPEICFLRCAARMICPGDKEKNWLQQMNQMHQL